MEVQDKTCNPPKLLILPSHASPDARIITLPHPRTEAKSRFYFCPETGFYEFTRIVAPKTTPRSWLLVPNSENRVQPLSLESNLKEPSRAEVADDFVTISVPEGKRNAKINTSAPLHKGYITKSADVFISTPLDPLFLLIPALCPNHDAHKSEASKQLFLATDDYFDMLTVSSRNYSYILDHTPTRNTLEVRMAAVCDSVEVADQSMYRLSNQKLLDELISKAKRLVEKGLPTSLEDKLVRKALEIPLMGVKREDSSFPTTAESFREETVEVVGGGIEYSLGSPESPNTTDTQRTYSTAATSFSEESQTESVPVIAMPPISAPEGIPQLLRLRSALSYLFSAYVPHYLSLTLNKMLTSEKSPLDFSSLDLHLSYLATLRERALASRSLSDFSRKRSIDDDDESSDIRVEKRRKKEEEERKKKFGESRGVRDLKKVDVSGMKKLSDFFAKGAAKRK